MILPSGREALLDMPLHPHLVLLAIGALTAGILVLDLHTPLGVMDGVLYLLPLLLTAWMPQRHLPFRLATVFTGLILLGAFLSPPGAPIETWGTNRVMSIVAIWAVVAFLVQRRREETLHRVHDDLEHNVQERTAALVEANAALRAQIVERLKTEDALRESEERYRQLIDLCQDAIYVLDDKGIFVLTNPAGCTLLGSTEQELVGMSVVNTYLPEERPAVIERLQQLKMGSPLRFERVAVRKDGTTVPIEVSLSPMTHGRYQAVVRDITERKQAEEAAREITNALMRAVPGISCLDTEGRYVRVDRAYAQMIGFQPSELIGASWQPTVHPDDLQLATDAYGRMLGEGKAEFEARAVRKDGTLFAKHVVLVKRFDKGGAFIGHHCFMMDITERKQTEEALRESEAFKNRILESSPDCIKVLDLEGRLLFMNKGGQDLMEICDIASLLNSQWVDVWKGVDKQMASAAVAIARAGGIGRFIGFCPTATGKPKWWDVLITSLLDASGAPDRLLSISRDITERKLAEEALKESESRHRAILKSALDCIISIDHEGRIVEFNTAAEETFGYKRDEVIGKLMADLIIPPSLRERHYRGFARHFDSGETLVIGKRLEFTAMRADGTEFPVELTVTRVDTGAQPMFTAFIRDITERKRAQQIQTQLLEQMMSVQEEERRRIARELHDETGQALTSLLVGLRAIAQARTLAKAVAQAEELRKTAAQALYEVQRLAYGLRPSVLDDIGLEAALRRYAADYAHTHKIPVQVDVIGLEGRRLPASLETVLYRITQEALTNAAKHASAKSVNVFLHRHPADIQLIVEDDGNGFEVGAGLSTAGASSRLGLYGMRERVAMLQGSIAVESAAGKGTAIYVKIPL